MNKPYKEPFVCAFLFHISYNPDTDFVDATVAVKFTNGNQRQFFVHRNTQSKTHRICYVIKIHTWWFIVYSAADATHLGCHFCLWRLIYCQKVSRTFYRDLEKDTNSTMSHKTEKLPIIVSMVNPRLLCGGGGKKQRNPDWGSVSKETFFGETLYTWKSAMDASLKLRNMPENSRDLQHKM